MIWVRRILTIPLIVILVLLFSVLLFVTQVNGTLGNPEFYNDQLRQADVYNFVYDDVLPAALEEVGTAESASLSVDISALRDEIVSAAREILPPEWLREQVERAANTLMPYLLDNEDSFSYTLILKDRVEVSAEVIRQYIIQGDAFAQVYDDAVSQLAEQATEYLDEPPFAPTIGEEEVEDLLRGVFPEEWVVAEVEEAVDSLTPYITGDSDHFTIAVGLRDQVDAAAAVLIDLLSTAEAYDYLVDQLLTPIIEENLGSAASLAYGITLSQEEISSAVAAALPQVWVQAQVENIVNTMASYLKGETNSVRITVDLRSQKAAAVDAIAALVDEEIEAVYYDLPECTVSHFLLVVLSLPPDTLPDCRPYGVSYEEAKRVLNIDVAAEVEQAIGDQIPDQWVYSDADLGRLLGEEHYETLLEARDWIAGGWTFTESDLEEMLDSEGEEALEDLRGWIENGYTVTEVDLREAIAETPEELEDFDYMRRTAATARTWLWSLWLIPVLLLIGIGLLGGRNWWSRLAWALVVLLFTSLAVYIAIGVTYSRAAEPHVQDVFDPAEYDGVAAVIAEKGNEIVESAANAFVSGIQSDTLYTMIGCGVALLGVIGWSFAERRRGRSRPNGDTP